VAEALEKGSIPAAERLPQSKPIIKVGIPPQSDGMR